MRVSAQLLRVVVFGLSFFLTKIGDGERDTACVQRIVGVVEIGVRIMQRVTPCAGAVEVTQLRAAQEGRLGIRSVNIAVE